MRIGGELMEIWPNEVCDKVISPISVMNVEWDYSYYQPWSDNKWLVDEMLIIQDKDITI